jgi:RecJ-like exonuclease
MEKFIITKVCSKCKGTGVCYDYKGIEITCPACNGTGKVEFSVIDITDLVALLNKMSSNLDDIMVKLDV